MSRSCAVHRHREYVPIEVHHIWPKGMGGPDTAANKVAVCANAHSAIHEYMRLLKRYAGKPPLSARLRYGAGVRRYALRGWREAAAGASAQELPDAGDQGNAS